MSDDVKERGGRLYVVALIACFVLGSVFIAAAVVKILHPADFAKNVYNYQAIPDLYVNPVAVFVPWLELVVGVGLIFLPRYRLASAWMSLWLLLFFTILIIVTVLRGIDITCGCFSVDPEAGKVGWRKVAENFGFIVLALIAVAGCSRVRPATPMNPSP